VTVQNREIDALFDPQHPNDLRFQFEIIKGLAESVRTQTAAILGMKDQQTDIVARLERIEAKEVAELLAALIVRVEALEDTELRREGGARVITAVIKSPIVGWVVGGATFMWAVLTGRIHL
jgi:hypothetical protein